MVSLTCSLRFPVYGEDKTSLIGIETEKNRGGEETKDERKRWKDNDPSPQLISMKQTQNCTSSEAERWNTLMIGVILYAIAHQHTESLHPLCCCFCCLPLPLQSLSLTTIILPPTLLPPWDPPALFLFTIPFNYPSFTILC